jgi:hypothetical protein
MQRAFANPATEVLCVHALAPSCLRAFVVAKMRYSFATESKYPLPRTLRM